ncbi:hypothetical protein DNTS_008259 [Danionella cerebrum]|uniref:Uncharacterized protein n=1 Tax=Danionella cerebrum TaxID=2873325 RepID=A0A553R6D8_9TELE|nr:hypothetical protein DNTS_008259 [Danionella translucida]
MSEATVLRGEPERDDRERREASRFTPLDLHSQALWWRGKTDAFIPVMTMQLILNGLNLILIKCPESSRPVFVFMFEGRLTVI